jgi:hypothetical protein
MSEWANFFFAEATASSALVGLIFVAISINLNQILAAAHLPRRAIMALVILMSILIISSLMLVPGQSLTVIGGEILGIGCIIWYAVTRLEIAVLRSVDEQYRSSQYPSLIINQLVMLLYIAAGILILAIGKNGLYVLVPAMLFSFMIAITEVWVLMVEIKR